MQVGDILTLDYSDKYLLLNIINSNNKNYYLAVGVNQEETDIDLEDITFFEEIKENNDLYVEEVLNPKIIDILTDASMIQSQKAAKEYQKILEEYYNENK